MGRSGQLAGEYGLWGEELGATEIVRPGFHSGLRSVSNSNGHVSYAILSNEKKGISLLLRLAIVFIASAGWPIVSLIYLLLVVIWPLTGPSSRWHGQHFFNMHSLKH